MQNIHFLDIESVRGCQYMPMEGPIMEAFKRKFNHEWIGGVGQWEEIYNKHAGLLAEFGKIISASIGTMVGDKFYVKTITGKEEKIILEGIAVALVPPPPPPDKKPKPMAVTLAGHNIKDFDIPFTRRRFIINRIPLPDILNDMGKKEYNLPYKDTMQLWGGSQWKYMTSQDLLCALLDIPSNKWEITGADIGELYYSIFDGDGLPWEKEQQVFEKIGKYNAGDVVASARIYARLMGFADIKEDNIMYMYHEAKAQVERPLLAKI